jgi:carbonic anhydrase
MKTIPELFANNQAWAAKIKQQDPDYFLQLSKQQKPDYLWIGCSDSRVAANQIIDLRPGEVFVHRNIANLVAHSDLNCLSVIQFAVEVLKVKHIIVCGHYGCGGIAASLEDENHGLIDNWLQNINNVTRLNQQELDNLDNITDKQNRLCELNVIEQVRNVCNTTTVQKAWKRQQNVSVHGWIYSISNGILKDLEVSRTLEKHSD